tara:strand:+ start:1058 stop:2029 length:972 start_codon:yes stop_codon:yes gene_type:complete
MIKKGMMNKSGKVPSGKTIAIFATMAILIALGIFAGFYFKSKTLENQADELDKQANEIRAQIDRIEVQITKAEEEKDEDEVKYLKRRVITLTEDAEALEKQADAKLNEAADAAEEAAKKLKDQANALRDKTGTRWKDATSEEKVAIIKEKTLGVFTKTIPTYTKKILGFEKWNEDDLGFWKYLGIGLLAGLWMWLGTKLKNIGRRFSTWVRKKGLSTALKIGHRLPKKEWLDFLAGDFWRIVIIGLGYAILMQVPIINRFIQIITFETIGLNPFFVSIVISFYIGFGPAWIEQYARYRLRMKYYKKITQIKYGAKMTRAMSSN